MINNDKGFSFFESIISLNILVLFCILIVPALTQLFQRKEQLQLKNKADDILTDTVHSYFLNREDFTEGDLQINGQLYTIYRNENMNGNKQICVKWISRTKEGELCEEISK